MRYTIRAPRQLVSRPGQGIIYQTQPFEIPHMYGGHPLGIYLPPDYSLTDKSYPVIYMCDGQNVFGDEGTFAGGWHMHDVLNKRHKKGLPVPIVVAIHHGPHRDEELCPWPPFYRKTAKGNRFLDWITEWLHPKVRQQLRVKHGAANCMIGGSSLGGLLALYGFARHQDVFGRALIMSPALWVHNGEIFPYVMKSDFHVRSKVYIDHGALEGCECHGYISYEQSRLMAGLLEAKMPYPETQVHWHSDSEGDHNEQCWRKRLPGAFAYLLDSGPTH